MVDRTLVIGGHALGSPTFRGGIRTHRGNKRLVGPAWLGPAPVLSEHSHVPRTLRSVQIFLERRSWRIASVNGHSLVAPEEWMFNRHGETRVGECFRVPGCASGWFRYRRWEDRRVQDGG